MELKLRRKADTGILEIKGELDMFSIHEFREMQNSLPEGLKTLYLDFQKVTFVDSESLSHLMEFHQTSKKNGLRLVLARLPDHIDRLMRAAGLDRFFEIEDSIEE